MTTVSLKSNILNAEIWQAFFSTGDVNWTESPTLNPNDPFYPTGAAPRADTHQVLLTGPKLMCPIRWDAKTHNIRVQHRESFIDGEVATQEMGALAIPQIHFKKGQSSSFFYVKGKKKMEGQFL